MTSEIRRQLTRLLTHDFCPWLNRWVYWIKNPLVCLLAAAGAAALCALFVKSTAVVGLAILLFVVVTGYLWPWISVSGTRCHLTIAQTRVTEGDTVCVTAHVSNRWPWRIWGLTLTGDLLPDADGRHQPVPLPPIPARTTTEFQWNFLPICRGEYPRNPPRLVTTFPFGLRRASRMTTIDHRVLVWPKLIPLQTLLDAAQTRPSDETFSENRVGPCGDIMGTRPFRAGDSLRRVHWAQTARHGQLIVRELQDTVQSSIRVVFDSDPRMHRGNGTGDSLEWSIRIAASVCRAYHRENAEVECCFSHETISLKPGQKGFSDFLDRLARWQPCHHGPKTPIDSIHFNTQGLERNDVWKDNECLHHHSHRECHRSHHRNCGLFQLTITTEQGLSHRTKHRHVHGDQRWVVLTHPFQTDDCPLCGDLHRPPASSSIVVECTDKLPLEFSRKWRQACHAG